MATKTANILARIEPEIKEKAEEIMNQLGIPASVVINMLYKQIVMTRSIPFKLTVPTAPLARDEMSAPKSNEMMQIGLDEAKADTSRLATDVFAGLRREV